MKKNIFLVLLSVGLIISIFFNNSLFHKYSYLHEQLEFDYTQSLSYCIEALSPSSPGQNDYDQFLVNLYNTSSSLSHIDVGDNNQTHIALYNIYKRLTDYNDGFEFYKTNKNILHKTLINLKDEPGNKNSINTLINIVK